MNTGTYLAEKIIAEHQRALVEAADQHRLARNATDMPFRQRWARLWAARRRSAVTQTAKPDRSGLPLSGTTA